MSQQNMQVKKAQEASFEQTVSVGGESIQALESEYDKRNAFLRQPQAVRELGCTPMHSLIKEYREKIGKRWYIRKDLMPEIKEQLERGRIAGIPENMINIEEAVKKSELPKSFIIKNAEFTKYRVTKYLNEETIPSLIELYKNKHLVGVPEGMILLKEAVKQSGVPLYFLRAKASTKKLHRRLFIYEAEFQQIEKEYRQKGTSRVPKLKGMSPIEKAAKSAGCSQGHTGLKAIAQVIDGYWYVPKDKLRAFKKERLHLKHEKIERQRASEYEAEKQTLFDKIQSMSAILSDLKNNSEQSTPYDLMLGEVLTLLPDVIQSQESAYRSTIKTLEKKLAVLKSQLEEKPSEQITTHKLRSLVDRRVSELERKLASEDKQFREDTANEFEYKFGEIKQGLHRELDEVLKKAAEEQNITGDYYQGKRFEDLAKKYKYMHRFLNKTTLFSRGNFPLMRALRWIIGKEPKDHQLKAVESLFYIINNIEFHSSDLGYENIDAFKDALTCCDGKDKNKIAKVLNNYGLARQSMNNFSAMLMVKKIITDLDEIPTPEPSDD